MSGSVFDCHTRGTWEGRNAAKHFTVGRTAPHNKESAVQNVSSARVGKPYSEGNKMSWHF